ncbi:hypothetical protein QE435_004929 [Rhizobium sp. SORGH_AS 787]|nr:hypothetical protein [Rhizobium sp. SORGH_AS_0787]
MGTGSDSLPIIAAISSRWWYSWTLYASQHSSNGKVLVDFCESQSGFVSEGHWNTLNGIESPTLRLAGSVWLNPSNVGNYFLFGIVELDRQPRQLRANTRHCHRLKLK